MALSTLPAAGPEQRAHNAMALPVVYPGVEPFPRDTFDRCAEGACGNCGLCCRVMEKTVPSVRGKINSALATLPAGRKCPQLLEVRGRFYCALQAHKEAGDPRLSDCRNWHGAGPGLAQVLAKTEEWIMRPANLAEVREIQELIDLELFQSADFTVHEGNLCGVLRRYLTELCVLPHDIFHMLGIGAALGGMEEPAVIRLLMEAGVDDTLPLHREFLATYVGPLGSRNPDPAEGFMESAERRLARGTALSKNERAAFRRRLLGILMEGASEDPQVRRASALIERVEGFCPPKELGALVIARDERGESFRGP